jgi:hypothetical protein
MVFNVLKSHSINFPITFLYVCYVTTDTVIWAIVHLICSLGPLGRLSLYLETPEMFQNGNSWASLRAGQLNQVLLPPIKTNTNNRNTKLYRWIFYRHVWGSTRNALVIIQSIAINRLVTTALESEWKFNHMAFFMGAIYSALQSPGSCAAESRSNVLHTPTQSWRRDDHACSYITTWYGNCLASDPKALQRVMHTAQYINGAKLPAIRDLYTRRCQRKALKMFKDSSHPSHRLFSLLLHSKRYRCSKSATNRPIKSFYPQAIDG